MYCADTVDKASSSSILLKVHRDQRRTSTSTFTLGSWVLNDEDRYNRLVYKCMTLSASGKMFEAMYPWTSTAHHGHKRNNPVSSVPAQLCLPLVMSSCQVSVQISLLCGVRIICVLCRSKVLLRCRTNLCEVNKTDRSQTYDREKEKEKNSAVTKGTSATNALSHADITCFTFYY